MQPVNFLHNSHKNDIRYFLIVIFPFALLLILLILLLLVAVITLSHCNETFCFRYCYWTYKYEDCSSLRALF